MKSNQIQKCIETKSANTQELMMLKFYSTMVAADLMDLHEKQEFSSDLEGLTKIQDGFKQLRLCKEELNGRKH